MTLPLASRSMRRTCGMASAPVSRRAVIGRASPDGSLETNHHLALRRMNLVSQFIERVIYEGMTETQRDAHRIRIRPFTLPTAAPIQPDRYRSTYLQNPDGSEPLALEPLMTDGGSLITMSYLGAERVVVEAWRAAGMPVAFATNGTVRLARGFTSIT